MDSGVIITAAIMIALCSLPFIISSRKRKKAEKQLLKSLTDAAHQQNGKISRYEICGDYAIGMDEVKGFIFFKNKSQNQEIAQFIDLGLVQSCEMNHTGRTLKNNGDTFQVIDRLDIRFIPKTGNDKTTEWVFYSAQSNRQLDGELQSIEKWSKLIKDRLKSNS